MPNALVRVHLLCWIAPHPLCYKCFIYKMSHRCFTFLYASLLYIVLLFLALYFYFHVIYVFIYLHRSVLECKLVLVSRVRVEVGTDVKSSFVTAKKTLLETEWRITRNKRYRNWNVIYSGWLYTGSGFQLFEPVWQARKEDDARGVRRTGKRTLYFSLPPFAFHALSSLHARVYFPSSLHFALLSRRLIEQLGEGGTEATRTLSIWPKFLV